MTSAHVLHFPRVLEQVAGVQSESVLVDHFHKVVYEDIPCLVDVDWTTYLVTSEEGVRVHWLDCFVVWLVTLKDGVGVVLLTVG